MLYRLLACLFLCGCSIHPLYENTSSNKGMSGSVTVEVIPGKHGQKLRGYLCDLLRDIHLTNQTYSLVVSLSEVSVPYAYTTADDPQRTLFDLTAAPVLNEVKGKKISLPQERISIGRNVASSQGDVLLAMYDSVNNATIKELAFRIFKSVKVALSHEN